MIPEWTQPNPTAEQIRLNGGVPPPPQPVLPTEFTIQLYNPDQQVIIKWHASTWRSDACWEFEMPQQSFRKPSTSALDRTQSDPAASDITPKLGFKWRKEGKLSKDFVCTLSGKSSNPDGSKRKHREPDITIALFRHFKEITIYEPNLSRVDMEDPKGLEVVLLLGAIVIREVFSSNMREAFNITGSSRRNSAENNNNNSSCPFTTSATTSPPSRRHAHSASTPTLPSTSTSTPQTHEPPSSRPPPTDPRSQWELDVETARLRAAQESEQRARRKAEHAETKRVKRMLEDEERKAREKRREIDRETERLRKLYGQEQNQGYAQAQAPMNNRPVPLQPPSRSGYQPQSNLQPPPQGYAVTAYPPAPVPRPHSAAPAPYIASNLHSAYDVGAADGYVGSGSSNLLPRPAAPKKKSSFWGLRGGGNENSRLAKQRSTVF